MRRLLRERWPLLALIALCMFGFAMMGWRIGSLCAPEPKPCAWERQREPMGYNEQALRDLLDCHGEPSRVCCDGCNVCTCEVEACPLMLRAYRCP